MKIFIGGPQPPPVHGCSYANKVLLEGLTQRGHFVRAFAQTPQALTAKQGDRFSLRKSFSFLRNYINLYWAIDSHVIYLTPGQTFWGLVKFSPFIVAALILRIPFILHLHGNHLGAQFSALAGVRRAVFKALVGRAAGGIVLSEGLRGNFSGLLASHRIFVVENFAGDDIFLRGPLCKDTEKLRLLFLSNLMREKGVLDFLDALLILQRRGVVFEAKVAGALEAGIEREVTERLRDLDGVTYCGTVAGDVKLDVLGWANVFVLPTYYRMEGQPIALLEALASGNIVVTTRHAGIADVITEDNGFFVNASDPVGISDVLCNIAKNLRCSVERFADSNRKYAASRFTEAQFVANVETVLLNAVGSVREDAHL